MPCRPPRRSCCLLATMLTGLPLSLALAWTSPNSAPPSRLRVRHLGKVCSLVDQRAPAHQPRSGPTWASLSRRRSPAGPLRNVPLEDVLEVELDELEAEMDLAKPKVGEGEEGGAAAPQRPMRATDAASIIAGTAIGGGFLALPSVTNPIGYLPTAFGLVAAWGFLLLSAVAFVEAAGLVADARARGDALDPSAVNGEDAAAEEGATSVATVIRCAFGKRWALLGGAAFVAQMLAVVTAQVVKGGEITSRLLNVPYAAGCLIPPVLGGLFAFGSRPEVVEGANTALTATMIGGFVALIFGTLASDGGVGRAAGSLFGRSDWLRLLPNTGVAWAMPVFINLLCFGQAMPLVVERMVQGSSSNGDGDTNDGLSRARSAAALGSAIPLALSVTWAAISTALVAPSSTDPLFSLLACGPAIAIPVGLLATGAIGTTLLGSFLAMGHFASDIVCMKFGHCSLRWMNAANIVTVAIPCVLACLGPSLYLPLLAFAGAYPTTLLHGLAPSLAAIVLRRRARKAGIVDGAEGATPRLIPGGEPTLVALAGTALGLVGASSLLAFRHILRAFAV